MKFIACPANVWGRNFLFSTDKFDNVLQEKSSGHFSTPCHELLWTSLVLGFKIGSLHIESLNFTLVKDLNHDFFFTKKPTSRNLSKDTVAFISIKSTKSCKIENCKFRAKKCVKMVFIVTVWFLSVKLFLNLKTSKSCWSDVVLI